VAAESTAAVILRGPRFAVVACRGARFKAEPLPGWRWIQLSAGMTPAKQPLASITQGLR
jgi:hypothetical protein